MQDCVVIGGGVAGLAAANRLLELGVKTTLIERGIFPSHKMCGEFFSTECLPILKAWGVVFPQFIRSAAFLFPNRGVEFLFPTSAGSISRYELDYLLVERARSLGLELFTECETTSLKIANKGGVHEIALSSGRLIRCHSLVIAVGRLPQLCQPLKVNKMVSSPSMHYFGMKAHFIGEVSTDQIEMYPFPGGYIGVSSVGKGVLNVAGLMKMDNFQELNSAEASLDYMIAHHPLLRKKLSSLKRIFPEWLTCKIPEFGLKRTPDWPHTYFIGDAAATIPPICGGGLSLAIASGCLAAEYVARGTWKEFKVKWKNQVTYPVLMGRAVHWAMLQPLLAHCMARLATQFSSLPRFLFSATRMNSDKKK